ncbi:hypothetical protein DKX38_013837 [Salix brachista]|uniref:Uncharacterized protein n=1 Tax=Salix brachista TaxID=2182728 RepID=A0A5N5LDN9_9ROSI|nr:hypothetical protein DKX38_013837 [Salix brachista]
MDSSKQGVCSSSSSSSFTANLFGTTESAPVSSAGVFASMFPPPSTVYSETSSIFHLHALRMVFSFVNVILVLGRKSSGPEMTGSWQKQSYGNQTRSPKQGSPAKSQAVTYSMPDRDRNPVQEERMEPCHLSSSLYYGGQENYSQSPGTQMAGSYPIFKKDGGEDDPSSSNPHSASRGNWWQGIQEAYEAAAQHSLPVSALSWAIQCGSNALH